MGVKGIAAQRGKQRFPTFSPKGDTVMKALRILLLAVLLAAPALAQDILPFGVTLGGQAAAKVEGDANFAHFLGPVASGAAMGVKGATGQVIVNIFPSDDKGVVGADVQPAILLFDAGQTKSINDNVSGKKHGAGWYAANVVCGAAGTSRVLFQVK
jgi:hypothetical protein